MAASKRLQKMFILLRKLIRTFTFQMLNQPAYCVVWRNRQKHVRMILRYMSKEYLHIVLLTYRMQQCPYALSNQARQYLFPVLCYLYHMLFAITHTVRCFAIIFHRSSYQTKVFSWRRGIPPRRRHEKDLLKFPPSTISGPLVAMLVDSGKINKDRQLNK